MDGFIKSLPKVELHIHIEGTLEPELMFELALRNKIELRYRNVEHVRQAYEFDDLQSFLDLYYQGAQVLQTERDFYDLTWAYLQRCKMDCVVHTEIFFDPQTHTARGVSFDTIINGITRALEHGKDQLQISSHLIMCFLRHLSEQDAIETLMQSVPYKDQIIGVGLDSSEQGHPPAKFSRVFEQARELGYLTVAHAGEEGPASNIWDGIKMLNIARIDHGVRCIEDESLVKHLAKTRIPLTVCPLSNVKLKVFQNMAEHNVVKLLREGLCVTINSDDPAYFGGYMTDNYLAVAGALDASKLEMAQFSQNAIEASFLDARQKADLKQVLQHYVDQHLRQIL